MDDKLFKQRLSEVAEWCYVDTDTKISNGQQSRRGRPRAQEQDQNDDQEQEYQNPEPTGINTTQTIQVVKLKHKAETCGDCGRHCEQGLHREQKLYDRKRLAHWRRKCVTCGMVQNPYTGRYELTTNESNQVFVRWIRATFGNGKYHDYPFDDSEDNCVIINYRDSEIKG